MYISHRFNTSKILIDSHWRHGAVASLTLVKILAHIFSQRPIKSLHVIETCLGPLNPDLRRLITWTYLKRFRIFLVVITVVGIFGFNRTLANVPAKLIQVKNCGHWIIITNAHLIMPFRACLECIWSKFAEIIVISHLLSLGSKL